MSSPLRPLRGGCQCGRNRYIIEPPPDATELAQVLFETDSLHQIPLASPLAAFLRIPLSWYHSTTYPFFPDESHAMIRRVYTHPSQQHAKRQFCGFCGTPLSYWSEEPRSEAEYLNVTLGSLQGDDLRDLEELGLIPGGAEGDAEEATAETAGPRETRERGDESGVSKVASSSVAMVENRGVPWFDSIMEGSRLGNLRRSHGVRESRDGKVRVEWEIVEFSSADDGEDVEMAIGHHTGASPAKRKLQDREDEDAGAV